MQILTLNTCVETLYHGSLKYNDGEMLVVDDQEMIEIDDESNQEQLLRSKVEDVATKIMALSDAEYNALNLDNDIRKEFNSARSLDTPKARRRETRQVVRAILDDQFDSVREDFIKLGSKKITAEVRYAKIEKLRDKILAGDKDVIETTVSTYSGCDRQHLRNLQRNAQKEKSDAGKSKVGRTIFLYLKELHDQ